MPVRPLSAELAEKARLELNEDPKKLEDGIQHIKEWIAKQPHLRARTDDQWLAAFLRGCKFSLERTKEKIDLNYSLRTTAPELFSINHRSPKFREIFNLGSGLVLPKSLKSTEPRVILIRPGLYDPAKYSITEVMSVMGTLMKILYVEDDTYVVAGGINIMDIDGATMAHAAQVSPAVMKKMAVVGQLHIHNKDFESLYKHVPQQVLPAEYGGQGGTVQEIIDYWYKKIEEYSDWLDEDLRYGTDEAQRPGKPKTAEDLFGIDGSFRQLEFD